MTLWLWQDLKRAVQYLGRHPAFALGVIFVLAVGIGPVATLFSLMHGAFLRPWRVPDPNGLAILRPRPAAGEVSGVISIAEYRYFREYSRSFSNFAARQTSANNLDDGSEPQRVHSAHVSADYFDALRVPMALGRSFVRDEEDYSAPKAVAIISHRLWETRFGSDPAVIGRSVRIDRQPFVIAGVTPRGYVDADRRTADLWMPLPAKVLLRSSLDIARFADPRGESVGLLAVRLNPGVTRGAAAAEVSALSRRFRTTASLPSAGIDAIDTRPISGWPTGYLITLLPVQALLTLTVVLLLALSCANAGNLVLARAIARRREIAIYVSLGASRARIVRQLVIETLVLSTLAGALALLIAFASPRLMTGLGFAYGADGFGRITSPAFVQVSYYTPGSLVFWIAFVLVTVTAVVAGLAPAMQVTRDTPTSFSAANFSLTPSGSRWRMTLLVVQIAVTVVLLAGAGLLTRAIGHAAALNPGFAIKDVQVVSVKPEIPPAAMMSPRGKAFFVGLRDALQNSGIGQVALAEEPPLWTMNLVMMARRPESPGTIQQIQMRRVSRDYFGVLGIPIIKGRVPESDIESRELVVNEAAARVLWAGADPIGRTLESAITRTEFQAYRVVGISKNVPVRSMSEIEPVIYRMPDWTPTAWTASFFVRGTASDVGQRVRAMATSLESQVTVTERPMVDYVRESLTTAELASHVAWAIGALGVVLAMVGAFGVFAQAAESRRREIGIRMALGASRPNIAALVLRTASQAVVWGLVAGFLLSILTVPVLRSFLYGLNPFDPLVFAGVVAIMTLAAGVATWIPVRRAVVVDPATTLRAE